MLTTMRLRRRLRRGLLGSLCLVVAACSPAGGQGGPSVTPLPRPDLQHLYSRAADAYNRAEVPVQQAENTYCQEASAQASLSRCETALSQDRQATIAFDSAIRGLAVPAAARGSVSRLLADDAQLESLLLQAATAPSLAAVDALAPQLFALLETATRDAQTVRADIGLPAPTTPPVVASGSPSA